MIQHTLSSPSINQSTQATLDFKLGQRLQATVTNIDLEKNTLTLALNNKKISVSIHNETAASQQKAASLRSGQSLNLIVNKTAPQLEFKLSDSKQPLKNSPSFILNPSKITLPPVLSANIIKPIAQTEHKTLLAQLPLHQRISASVVQNNTSTLQLKLLTPQAIHLSFKPLSLPKHITQISLQVIKTGEQPQFKILPALSPETLQQQALKMLLPQQMHSPMFFNQLIQQLPMLAESEQVSDTLKRLAQKLLDSLPSKQQMGKATQLKQSFEQSGLFLEKKLSQSTSQPPFNLDHDLKLKLKYFVQALKQELHRKQEKTPEKTAEYQALKDLQSKSEGALAKLILNQLKSLPPEESNKQIWIVDLPFLDKKQTQSVQIQIKEETHKNAQQEEQKVWSATLSITPPNLKTLHCKISFFDGKVHTRFSSDSADTTQIIQQNLGYLAEHLTEAGLTTGHLIANQAITATASLQPTEKQTPLFSSKV